ncbi:MAG: hypothetical protein AB9866_20280 [Syntrophobacteraceae bacterium]
MNVSRKRGRKLLIWLCMAAALLALPLDCSAGEDIRGEGLYTLFPNGDVSISVKLTPSMLLYQQLRESFSNLYLVLRTMASERSDAEVAEKKADWDDPNHTMVFSMKVLGAAKNLGDHWEIECPKGTDFINVDEGKRTFYFNETAPIGTIATIRGTSRLVLPPEAQNFKWEASRRSVSYTIPYAAQSGRIMALLIAGIALIMAGAVLTGISFRSQAPVAGVKSAE